MKLSTLLKQKRGAVAVLLTLLAALLVAAGVLQGATITTDQQDYYPGDTVVMTGSGWEPGETVAIHLVTSCGCDTYDWTTVADVDGNVADSSFLVTEDHLGITFYLTATGLSSGQVATHTFTDAPRVGSVTVSAQSGTATYGTAGSVTYTVTVNRGTGGGSSGNFNANLSVTSVLPAGVTASFSPSTLAFPPATSTASATLTLTTSATTNAGAYPFTVRAQSATVAGDNASNTGTLTVNKANQTITFAAIPDKTFGDPDFSISATASSGLPVSFATSGPISLVGSTVSITGAGAASVTASQAGDSNYNPAPNVLRAFNIAKASATLTLSDLSHTYEGSPKSATVTTSPPGLTVVTVTYDGSTTPPTKAGSYAIVASLNNPNYEADDATDTFVIEKADQTISFDPIPTKKFGDPDFDLVASATSGLPVSFSITAHGSVSGSTVSVPANGGASVLVTAKASQPGDSNYNPASDVERMFQLLENVAPSTSATPIPSPNLNGWNNGASVTVDLVATDNPGGDGVASITYSASGAESIGSTTVPGDFASVVITAEGVTTITFYATDNAGNVESAQTFDVKIDRTAPDVTATPDRGPDTLSGWYTAPVEFTFGATDGLSGLASLSPASTLYSGPDSVNALVTATATDNADNVNNAGFPFKYDATDPVITHPGLSGHCFESVSFHVAGSDNGSGAQLRLEVALEKNGLLVLSYDMTDVLPQTPQIDISGAANDGNYELIVTLTDEAGHVSTKSKHFEIDNEAPVVTYGPGTPADGSYVNTSQTLSWTITDLDTPLDTNETLTSLIVGANIGPTPVSSPVVVGDEGQHTLYLRAEDCVGHVTEQFLTFTIDLTAPDVNDAILAGTSGNPGWFKSPVNVTLGASDPMIRTMPASSSDIAGSGVKEIRYFATGADPQGSAGSPIVVSGSSASFDVDVEGITTITYWAVDNAGNAADVKEVVVRYDETAPSITQPADVTVTATDPTGADVVFPAPDVTDNIGVAWTMFSPPGPHFGVGSTIVTLTAADEAGNESYVTFTVNVENPVPNLTAINPDTKTFLDPAFTMNLTGEGFMPDSVARVDGSDRPTTFVSWTELSVEIPASDMDSAGTRDVTVFTPVPGGGTSGSVTFTVLKKDQTITFDPIPGKTYGDADFDISATSESSLPVEFEIVSGPATISGNTVHITGAGTVVVRAKQGGTANWNPAPDVDQSFEVAKANPSVVVTGGSFTYDANPHPASATVTGVFGEDLGAAVISYAPGGSAEPVDAGTYDVTADFAGNANYNPASGVGSIVILKADQTIAFAAIADKILGSAPFGLSATSSSGQPVTFSLVSGPVSLSGSTVTILDVGTVVVRASQAGNHNYNPAPNVDSTFKVLFAGNSGILPPVNPNGTSVFKKNSTVPAKVKVFDANGMSIGAPGTITEFKLVKVITGTAVNDVNEEPISTTPDTQFRWSASDQQWIFNIKTSNLAAGKTYVYRVTFKDGSWMEFQFGIK